MDKFLAMPGGKGGTLAPVMEFGPPRKIKMHYSTPEGEVCEIEDIKQSVMLCYFQEQNGNLTFSGQPLLDQGYELMYIQNIGNAWHGVFIKWKYLANS